MKKLIVWAIVLFAPATALAGPFGPPRGPVDAERVMERVDATLDEVEATDAQRSATKAILDDTLPELQALRVEGKAIRDDVRAAFDADKVDRVALETARLDLVELFDRATSTMFGMFADIADLYSPEQRAEWREIREARRERWRKRLGFDES